MDAIQKLMSLGAWIIPVFILGAFLLPQMIRVLREYERGVIFRLGRILSKPKGPGFIFVLFHLPFHSPSVAL